jgi:hypothetical protein
MEIKAGQTVAADFFKGIRFWKKLSNDLHHFKTKKWYLYQHQSYQAFTVVRPHIFPI